MRILPRAASAAVCAFLFLFTVNNSIAQPVHRPNAITCTSIASADWQLPTTWDTGVVPGVGDNVIIATGTMVTMPSDTTIGGGIVTVRSGAILDLKSASLTASKLIAENGSEVIQRLGNSPRSTILTYQLASDSTYSFIGNTTTLSDTQPIYGNLRIKPSASSNGMVATALTVLGNFIVDYPSGSELRLQSGQSYSFGGLIVQKGVLVLNRLSGSPVAMLHVAGNLEIQSAGTLRGTISSGHATLNLGGDLINNGTFQQDNGNGSGIFTVNLNGTAEQHISGLNAISFENLTINNSAGVVLDRDVAVDKTLTLTLGRVKAGDFTLLTGSGSTIAGAGENSYVEGYIAKEFSSNGSFAFPVGTNSGYSPVTATITALPTNPSKLSVAAFNGAGPGVDAANSVTRFWNIIEEGDLTANLTFSYRDEDVTTPAAEANYSLVKKDGNALPVVVCTGAGCINAAANTASAGGVTGFSRWAIGTAVAPSSAEAAVAGRVLGADARAVRGAFLTAVGTDGRVRYAVTNQFGHYSFRSLSAGETYTISIRSKQYTFAPSTRVITLNDAETNLDFIAEAP